MSPDCFQLFCRKCYVFNGRVPRPAPVVLGQVENPRPWKQLFRSAADSDIPFVSRSLMNEASSNASEVLSLNASAWFFAGQVSSGEPARHVPLHALPFRVGRRSNLPLTLPCDCVSKEHAEIFEREGNLWVRDLQSTNGTYINGERILDESPIQEGDIVQFATVVFRVGKQQGLTESGTIPEDTCNRALAMMQFDRLLNGGSVVPFFQPIVQMSDKSLIGYEVLGRSRLFGLHSPAEMFSTASQLNLEAELSRVLRDQGLQVARGFAPSMNLFVNTHPAELAEDVFVKSLYKLREEIPDRAITIEIHEAAITSPEMIRELRVVLADLGMGLAFDDFGAGQARLVELGEVSPDFLKFDMKLVRGIDIAPAARQQVVAALVKVANDLGTTSLAEGVENESTHQTLKQMGFQLGQGYHYGRPASLSKCLELYDRKA